LFSVFPDLQKSTFAIYFQDIVFIILIIFFRVTRLSTSSSDIRKDEAGKAPHESHNSLTENYQHGSRSPAA